MNLCKVVKDLYLSAFWVVDWILGCATFSSHVCVEFWTILWWHCGKAYWAVHWCSGILILISTLLPPPHLGCSAWPDTQLVNAQPLSPFSFYQHWFKLVGHLFIFALSNNIWQGKMNINLGQKKWSWTLPMRGVRSSWEPPIFFLQIYGPINDTTQAIFVGAN